MRSTSTLTLLALFAPMSAFAALDCSIRPDRMLRHADVRALAKISLPDAQSIALRAVKAPSAATATGDVELEAGCLVYSFDIKIPKKSGVEEVLVDAGDGRVLSRKHETPAQEAAEQDKRRGKADHSR